MSDTQPDSRDRSRDGAARPIASRSPFPDVGAPAMPPLWLFALLGGWVRAALRRQRVRRLKQLDRRLLDDLGHAPAATAKRRDIAR